MNEQELPVSVQLALAELKQALARLYGERFRGLYLYGSYARGTANENSDVDVVIALEDEVQPMKESSRLSALLSDICLRYDVLIAAYPVPEIWLRERESPLFENIRREGVLV
ncbi:MAG: nucleotidyltransferase domain-containing protein [Chloroflexi bacterium]|nr:nucleotidyltransferase domain-containing protein [Chloroflexota bacterium]